jgi:hypothetical protein
LLGRVDDLVLDPARREQQIDDRLAGHQAHRREPAGLGLFDGTRDAIATHEELADDILGFSIVGHRDDDIDVAREPWHRPRRHRETSDDGMTSFDRHEIVANRAERVR